MARVAGADDWARLRDLRLRSLADVPEAYATTLAQAQHLTDDEWRERASPAGARVCLVEEAHDGELVGMCGGELDPDEPAVAWLAAMFVEPKGRRAGVGRRLLEAFESWARERGAATVKLEGNPALAPAVGLYESCGYRRTRNVRPHPSAAGATVVEYVKRLSRERAATRSRQPPQGRR
jgi:GNAT superfamily N-acetyltransferase